MPELFFEVYCGNCGSGVCNETSVDGQTITITCSNCKDQIDSLEDQIDELENKIDGLEILLEALK